MKIALASAPVKNRNIEFNMQVMIDAMSKIRDQADVIVFGESVLQGFDSLCWDFEKDKHMAVTLTDAPIQRMCEVAKQCGIAVSFGFIERIEDALYSSQIFIGSDGEIVTVFHRVSIGWKECSKTDDHYREGKNFEKFCYGGKTFAIALCGDCVLLVNPFCADADATDAATGGAVCFRNGGIATEIPAGNSEMMFVEV